MVVVGADEQLQKDENFWEENRKTPLSESEKNIYVMMDELNNVPKFKRAVKLYETLASGYYNVGNAIDIGDLYFGQIEFTRNDRHQRRTGKPGEETDKEC